MRKKTAKAHIKKMPLTDKQVASVLAWKDRTFKNQAVAKGA